MLILTRKAQQSVIVGGSADFERVLKVTVIGISGSRVRLGFEVARDVPVHRCEVWERINGPGESECQPNTSQPQGV